MAVFEIREHVRIQLQHAKFIIDQIAVEPGQCLAILGDSTARVPDFMRLIGGQLPREGIPIPPEAGRVKSGILDLNLKALPIFVAGEQLYSDDTLLGIGYIDSDPDSIIGRTVLEEYFHALVAGGAEAEDQLAALDLRPFGLSDKLTRETRVLSGGEKHRLQTAGALAGDKKLVIADLSASNLDEDFVVWFLERMDGFCREGGVLIVAGLRWEQIRRLGNATLRNLVLESFQSEIRAREHAPNSTVVPFLEYKQGELKRAFKDQERKTSDTTLIRFSGVRRRNITAAVSFELRTGEIVRLTGRNGIGKTTVGDILMGRVSRREVVGNVYQAPEVRPAISRQFPDRCMIGTTIEDELPWPDLRQMCGICGGDLRKDPRDLPFGVRKLISVATTLQVAHLVAILDEPTCGMDFNQKKQFVELLNKFSDRAVLLITHDEALEGIGREVHIKEG